MDEPDTSNIETRQFPISIDRENKNDDLEEINVGLDDLYISSESSDEDEKILEL